MNIELTSGVYPVTVKIAAHVISELDPLTTEIGKVNVLQCPKSKICKGAHYVLSKMFKTTHNVAAFLLLDGVSGRRLNVGSIPNLF